MKLIVFCGSPGSGKTTLSREIAKEYGFNRISMDEMKIFRHKELIPFIVSSLQEGKDTIVDSLYTKTAWRKELLEALENIRCEKVLVYMDIPLEECLKRNAGRENSLDSYIVEDIYKSIEKPCISEGWDSVEGVSL